MSLKVRTHTNMSSMYGCRLRRHRRRLLPCLLHHGLRQSLPLPMLTPATNKLLKRGFLRTNERNVNISDISSPTSSAISLFATHLQTHLSTTAIVTLIVIIALTMDVTTMGPSSSPSCASASVRVHTRCVTLRNTVTNSAEPYLQD